nr:protein asteroid-like isoform X1 [Cherax quadricarinatus]
MGVRGLSTYIRENLRDTLEKRKLHNCNIIIDGNNLARILYYECTGINAAFGGDYDKYASFVEKHFESFQSCKVNPIVIMDGGKPLNKKKLKTTRERIQDQINMCSRVDPKNQYKFKIFPCMGRQVFVTTLQKMGITVLQTDFEADEEIARLSKILGYTVLSNDSDFFMYGVPTVLLDSIIRCKIHIGKAKPPREPFQYIACYHFNVDKFCKVTGMDRAHLPLLATLLGNDYIPKGRFSQFYTHLAKERQNSRGRNRQADIKNVITWIVKMNGKSMKYIINNVAKICCKKVSKHRILWSVNQYSEMKTNLLNILRAEGLGKSRTSLHSDGSQVEKCEPEDNTLIKNSEVETALSCKNGKKLPAWFTEAYRRHRIPHEVADILTHNYFISPPQVEENLLDCSYLVVEPIVRSVYFLLWKGVTSQKHLINCHNESSFQDVEVGSHSESVENYNQYTSNVMYDSDVVVEEEEEYSDVAYNFEEIDSSTTVSEEMEEESWKLVRDSEVEEAEESSEEGMGRNDNWGLDQAVYEKEYLNIEKDINYELTEGEQKEAEPSEEGLGKDDNWGLDKVVYDKEYLNTKKVYNELTEREKKCELIGDAKSQVYSLQWYLRKNNSIWVKKLKFLANEKASDFPSLDEVASMSLADKKKVFYSVLDTKNELEKYDLPADLELIFAFIIYWFRNSKLPLRDCHALCVMLCIFMYYIIDGKIGRVRTWKGFEDVEKCKSKISSLQKDASYCSPDVGVRNLLANTSKEECLVAAFNLFNFHHQKQRCSRDYCRKTVHAFSEYQACIYFLQLLNSLLCSPFPMLSVECLWGGTFCYNIFLYLKRKSNPIIQIAEMLGRKTCLEQLFLKLLRILADALSLKKSVYMLKNFKLYVKKNEKNIKMNETVQNSKSNEQEDKHEQNMHDKWMLRETKLKAKKKKGKRKNVNRGQLGKVHVQSDNEEESGKEEENDDGDNFYLLENRFAMLVIEKESASVE